jgi:hypothetical protein
MRRFTVISLLAAAAACNEVSPTETSLQRAGVALASQAENQKDAVELLLSACNGELVPMSGTLHQTFKFTDTKSGNVNAFVSADYNLSGVGPVTGADYRGSLKIRDQEMSSDNASTFSYRTAIKMIGAGSVPNSTVDVTVRVHVANGETRVESVETSTRCTP